jgi:hypothetical protein
LTTRRARFRRHPALPAGRPRPAPLTQGSLDAALARGGAQATNTVTGTPYYRFTLDTPQGLSIRAQNEAADPYIYLFDGTGALIAENDDYDSLNSRIDITDAAAAGHLLRGHARAVRSRSSGDALGLCPTMRGRRGGTHRHGRRRAAARRDMAGARAWGSCRR